MLACRGLRKQFGERTALDDVSFTVDDHECYGLLGPNGAGKTTTISIVCGLLEPDGGEVHVDGKPGRSLEAKAAIGYVPQDLALYPDLSARENLRFFGQLYAMGGERLRGRRLPLGGGGGRPCHPASIRRGCAGPPSRQGGQGGGGRRDTGGRCDPER